MRRETFKPEEYRRAALERLSSAKRAVGAGDYVEAVYIAGVAIECMLRGYRVRLDQSFDEGHDLWKLAHASHILQRIPDRKQERVRGALQTAKRRWANDHRYRSSDALLTYFRKHHLAREGPRFLRRALERNASELVEAAETIVTVGDQQSWDL